MYVGTTEGSWARTAPAIQGSGGLCSLIGAECATMRGMKYVSIRELRNRPGRVWSVLSKDDVVLTASGKPMGVLLGVDETRLDDTVAAIRRARAILAVSRMRRRAAETGKDRMSMAEINREIAAVRRRRRPA